jgi:Ion channel
MTASTGASKACSSRSSRGFWSRRSPTTWSRPCGRGEFEGLATRIDALYFALTTLFTVGYGDIHPVGQLARALVSVQMVLNVGVLALAGGLVVRGVADRLREGGPDGR